MISQHCGRGHGSRPCTHLPFVPVRPVLASGGLYTCAGTSWATALLHPRTEPKAAKAIRRRRAVRSIAGASQSQDTIGFWLNPTQSAYHSPA